MSEERGKFDRFLGVRLHRDEAELLRQFAELEGVSVSEFAREALRKEFERRLGADPTARP